VKTTGHFESRLAERGIRREWCERVLSAPLARVQQANGYFRLWGYIEEEGKYLRVVLLEDGETFQTAHWDRRFKGA